MTKEKYELYKTYTTLVTSEYISDEITKEEFMVKIDEIKNKCKIECW